MEVVRDGGGGGGGGKVYEALLLSSHLWLIIWSLHSFMKSNHVPCASRRPYSRRHAQDQGRAGS